MRSKWVQIMYQCILRIGLKGSKCVDIGLLYFQMGPNDSKLAKINVILL